MRRSMPLGLKTPNGFVTSELYVVIAVIGVLTAIAVPAYLDYAARSRIAEGIAVANAARDAVAKAHAAHGSVDMSQRATTGWTPPPPGDLVQTVAIERNGVVTIRYTEKAADADANQIQIVPVFEGKALDLSDPANRGVKFEWQCGGAAGNTTVRAKYLPGWCRGAASEGVGWIGGLLIFVFGAICVYVGVLIAWTLIKLVWKGLKGMVGTATDSELAQAAGDSKAKRGGAILTAALCLAIAAGAYALADGPWDRARLKTVVGTMAGHRHSGGTHPCFVIRLAEFKESFELCSTSYSKFDREGFTRDVRDGQTVVMRVVDDVKVNQSTGETKYWVQDIRVSESRIYLDLQAVQEHRNWERIAGVGIAFALVSAALVVLWRAFGRKT
jgi:type IV pilus assembly protein PilA